MTFALYAFLFALVLATSTISGVFGMAGGLILMGGLTLVLPVSAAMVAHGGVQIFSNGWRAVLHRKHVSWRIVALYAGGSLMAAIALAAVSYAPSKAWTFLMMGLVPGLAWLPKGWIEADAARPAHAFVCGLCVTALNLIAGVAGPLLDVFFVRTSLTRHQIVATKAATQVLSHAAKIIFYGAPFLAGGAVGALPLWFFAVAAPLAAFGAVLGGMILDKMTDQNFLKYTKWIVTAVGAFYLAQAAYLFVTGQG